MRGVVLVLLGAVLLACSTPEPAGGDTGPALLRVEVLEVLPHDADAFTQGLELARGTLYEGTGLRGESTLRAGAPGRPPHTSVELPETLFGEGITVVGDRIWQLTWKAGIAIERDRATLAERGRARYGGEGWGLCYQAGQRRLVMSDGTARLTFRDPGTFAELGSVSVRDGDRPVSRLNELECVDGVVYANVWQTDDIVRIEPGTGRVTARIDAAGLLTEAEQDTADVLNGVAAIPGTDQFLLTGKHWPSLFRVRFVPTAVS